MRDKDTSLTKEEARSFIKDTVTMVHLEDCYAPLPLQNKQTKADEKLK